MRTLLSLQNYRISPAKALYIAGYRMREQTSDFVREDTHGRFHLTKTLLKKVYELHYDTYIENRHVVFDLPMKESAEIKRIVRKLYWARTKEMDRESFREIIKAC